MFFCLTKEVHNSMTIHTNTQKLLYTVVEFSLEVEDYLDHYHYLHRQYHHDGALFRRRFYNEMIMNVNIGVINTGR
jgi:hypothetical protein